MLAVVASHVFDKLSVDVFQDSHAVGMAAAAYAARVLRAAIEARGQANLILATGNSQLAFFAELLRAEGISWDAVSVFHMDEYIGISADHPSSFRRFLREKLTNTVQPREVHEVIGDDPNPTQECERYAALLRRYPADLCCLGFGENGHIAFNEPEAADFSDPLWVKIVCLDDASRRQQVGEGHFPTVEDVPAQAITLTVPALLAARRVLAIVPELRKAQAVRSALMGPISTACPGSVLRTAAHARLLLDLDAFSLVGDEGAHVAG
jgi:glucosamine-6-phosphate deaminase